MKREYEWCAREEQEIPSDQFRTVEGTRLHRLESPDGASLHRATDGIEVEVDQGKLKELQAPPQPPGLEMLP